MPRRLSSASLSKYLIGGVYYDFIQYVKADKELAFEIRVKDEVQQQYKAEHSSFDGDYLAIDMEWAPDQAAIPVEYRLKVKQKSIYSLSATSLMKKAGMKSIWQR